MRARKVAEKLPPMHPGELLREEYIEPLGLTVCRGAKGCGVPRSRIERIVREDSAYQAIPPCDWQNFWELVPNSG